MDRVFGIEIVLPYQLASILCIVTRHVVGNLIDKKDEGANALYETIRSDPTAVKIQGQPAVLRLKPPRYVRAKRVRASGGFFAK